MDWDSILKSAVLAAFISSIVAGIGFWVSSTTARKINEDKLKLDKELAELKAAAEQNLAERKVELDRKLALAKRKAEIAEQALASIYRARRAFEIIRSPMIWANEMTPEEGVAQDIVENDGYGVIRRFRQYSELFSELEALRFTFGALFGHEATTPFDELVRVNNRVFHAAQALLQYRNQRELPQIQDHLRKMRREAFSLTQLGDDGKELPDQLAEVLAKIVADIEAVCRPALESELAAQARAPA